MGKNMNKQFGVLLCLFLVGCDVATKSEEVDFVVRPYKTTCVGLGPWECMVVSENGNKDHLSYDGINGFVFKWGEEVRIKVRKDRVKNPPADGSSIIYSFISETSRKRAVPIDFEITVSPGVRFDLIEDSLAIEGFSRKIAASGFQNQLASMDSLKVNTLKVNLDENLDLKLLEIEN
jgi:hypothetical protein